MIDSEWMQIQTLVGHKGGVVVVVGKGGVEIFAYMIS